MIVNLRGPSPLDSVRRSYRWLGRTSKGVVGGFSSDRHLGDVLRLFSTRKVEVLKHGSKRVDSVHTGNCCKGFIRSGCVQIRVLFLKNLLIYLRSSHVLCQ